MGEQVCEHDTSLLPLCRWCGLPIDPRELGKQLFAAAAARGIKFGACCGEAVILDPVLCCWTLTIAADLANAEEPWCPHVDQNVGTLVRIALNEVGEVALSDCFAGVGGPLVSFVEAGCTYDALMARGPNIAEALARFVLAAWARVDAARAERDGL